MAKISVIIPVYNVEQYLKECLESIINQTLKDIEIICVNDGSTDDSLEILNEFIKKDQRIKLITQKNKGLSAARNAGYNIATSEYIYFIDSDDWIELNTLENIYNKIIKTQSDVLLFGTNNVYGDNHIMKNNMRIMNLIKKYKTKDFCFIDCPDVIYLPCTAWLKIYKKSFLDSYNIIFEDDIKFSEDSIYWIMIVCRNAKIHLDPTCYHYYRFMRPNSMNLYNNILKKFLNTFKFFLNSTFYKSLDSKTKKYTFDCFLNIAIRIYSDINNINEILEYENVISDFYKLIKKENIFLSFRFSGYRLLKFRYLYTFLKKIVLFFKYQKESIKK